MGYYEALADLGEANPGQLAEKAGTNERYTREWLEQQAATGLIEVATASDDDNARTYRLIPGTEPVFTDTTGEQPILHFVRSVMASILPMADVIDAYRTGKGLPFGHYGEDMMIGQGMGTRWGFMTNLAETWIPAMPDIDERLRSRPDAQIADFGFGMGWSSIAFAQAYPNVRVDGFELDESSVRAARSWPMRRAWATGSRSWRGMRPTRPSPDGTTLRSLSSASMTWPTRSARCGRCETWSAPVGPS